MAERQAQYAALNYDVVYVRCPRGREPMIRPDGASAAMLNWGGVNDVWLSAANNIYQQPGCDLVMHHSDPAYGGGLRPGHPGREEVLVNCDEADASQAICTIADPNVAFDGRSIIYTKFTDTRQWVTDEGFSGDGGIGSSRHKQSFMRLYPDGDGPGGVFGQRLPSPIKAFNAPALIYRYDLQSRSESLVSPPATHFAGRAHPGKDSEWRSNIPVMDTGPFFMADGRIGFTSNRASGFYQFQLFAMSQDGSNLELLGHRAMGQQLHPATLKDGRVMYTSQDVMLQKVDNNNYSLFTINADGSDPFILAGKQDPTAFSYHYATQLSDGDVIVTLYYNHNNGGMGSLLRFPIDPPGPDFMHLEGGLDNTVPFLKEGWRSGVGLIPFARVGQFVLTPQARWGDAQALSYDSTADYWLHPSDGRTVTMTGKFSHPAAAPDNDLLVTYTIGGSSTMEHPALRDRNAALQMIGKDAGIWLLPLDTRSERRIQHIADDGLIVVDFPEYHEIMARPLVTYNRIYSMAKPGIDTAGKPTRQAQVTDNSGTKDLRLPAGAPWGLSGAASLYDRETRSLNGIPWNMQDGGGVMAGRTYLNLAANGADLAIFDNAEVYGIRVLLPLPPVPNNYSGGVEQWAGIQKHHMRILGEFPVRKADGTPLDGQGNPDTSFIVRLPADTPFLFQSIDKRGMALDIETAARTVARGEQQLCTGCHVHTREGMDPFQSLAKRDTSVFGDFTGQSAPLFAGLDSAGKPQVRSATDIYRSLAGVNARRSFAVDWKNGISDVIERRCASCHGEGKPAQVLTGLRLDGDDRSYELITSNQYRREDGAVINSNTRPGDGLTDVLAKTPGSDRITPRNSCCTPSRWLSLNSARSSMLVWALYGERMDGRDPLTGLPPAGSGVPVDDWGRENPEIWPLVGEHAAYVADMSEDEKRLIARWIDLGAPKLNIHDDLARPVLTLTPVPSGGVVNTVLVGVWDDSALDYSRFAVRHNGKLIMSGAELTGEPNVISVSLPVGLTDTNAGDHQFEFEIWDRPDRALSLVKPGVAAANRSRIAIDGRGLLRMVGISTNRAPRFTSATLRVAMGSSGTAVPYVDDPDVGDSHLISFVAQPAHGEASVENNKLVYRPNPGYLGRDSFTYQVEDLSGLTVKGTAAVEVVEATVLAVEAAAAGGGSTSKANGGTGGGTNSGGTGTVAAGGGAGMAAAGGGGALAYYCLCLLLLSAAMRRGRATGLRHCRAGRV